MQIDHRGQRPGVHPDAYIAPTAVLCGDVRIGAGAHPVRCRADVPRGTAAGELMRRQSAFYGAHRDDRVLEDET